MAIEAIVKFNKVKGNRVYGEYEGRLVKPFFMPENGEEWEVRLRPKKDGSYVAWAVKPVVGASLEDDEEGLKVVLRCGDVKIKVRGWYKWVAVEDGLELRVEADHYRYGFHSIPVAVFRYKKVLDPLDMLYLCQCAHLAPIPPKRKDLVAYAHQIKDELETNFKQAVLNLISRYKEGDYWFEPLPELPPKPRLKVRKWETKTYDTRTSIPPWGKVIEQTPSGAWGVKVPVYEIANLKEIEDRRKAIKDWWERFDLVEKVAIWCIVREVEPSTADMLATLIVNLQNVNPEAIAEILWEAKCDAKQKVSKR